MSTSVSKELKEIRSLIGSICLMEAVRREVRASLGGGRALVVDGAHAQGRVAGGGFDVVVLASGTDAKGTDVLSRRIRAALPDSEVSSVVDGVIGVRGARRGSKKGV